MKQELHFFIDKQELEFNEAPDILYSYKITDLTNPTVVYNSYSKTVTVPGTPNNNKVFGGIWDLNRVLEYGGDGTIYFDPSKKASFTIYLNGSIYESGYAKLINVSTNNNKTTYEIELYGGLGSMLYNLSYKAGESEDGKLKLSDLFYRYEDPRVTETDELTFKINKDAIWEAWNYYGPSAQENSLWHYINFMPCYNGFPEDFSTDKALINWRNMPQEQSFVSGTTKSGVYYGAYNGYSLATLPQQITEWEAKDLRSYAQRPVLRVKGLFNAIKNYVAKEENGGYDLRLDAHFFNTSNCYYNDAWITLPLLSQYDNTSQTDSTDISLSYSATTRGGQTQSKKEGIETNFIFNVSGTGINDRIGVCTFKCSFAANITNSQSGIIRYGFNQSASSPAGTLNGDAAIFSQLVAYDYYGNVLGGSDVNVLCYSPTKANIFPYTPIVKGKNYNYLTDAHFSKTTGNVFVSDDVLTYTIETNTAVEYYVLYTSQYGRQMMNGYSPYVHYNNNILYPLQGTSQGAVSQLRLQTASSNFTLAEAEKIRSNNTVTKSMLLDTEYSPAEYLLSYCKQFGLYFYKEPDTNIVHILDRYSFYKRSEVVNLDEYIDKSREIKITPIAFENKYYDFHLEAKGGEYEKEYKDTSSIPYGMKRVNTGYNFNRESKDLFEGNCYHGYLECLEKSKYNFENPDGKNPWLWDGTKYTLYSNGISNTTEQEIKIKDWSTGTPINPDLKYYDVFSKIQFHDADNKTFDGSNCLVFYSGEKEFGDCFYWVSDDVPEMSILNGGSYCWLVSNSGETATISGMTRTFALSNNNQRIAEAYDYLPHFTKYIVNEDNDWIIRGWDFGAPRTIYIPNVVYRENSTMYNAFWRDYISDMYNVNTRVLSCYVRLSERPNPEWLRRFYWFNNAIWRLNAITDWNITNYETTKMEFVKVQDINNYSNEFIDTAFTAYITTTATTIPSTGATIQVSVSIAEGGMWYLDYDENVEPEYVYGGGNKTFNVEILPNTSSSARTIYITASSDKSTTIHLQQMGGAQITNHRIYLEFNSDDDMLITCENCPFDMDLTLYATYRGTTLIQEFSFSPNAGGNDSVVLDPEFSLLGIVDLSSIDRLKFEDTGKYANTLIEGEWFYFDASYSHMNCYAKLHGIGKQSIFDNTEWGTEV